MTIGKFCQLCGAAQKPSEIIAEAHGVVVNVGCLLEKVHGEKPMTADEVEAQVRFCRLCGAELGKPRPGHCPQCGAAVLARDGEADLAKLGSPAPLFARAVAFIIDLVPVALLAWAAIYAAQAVAPSSITVDPSAWEPWAASASLAFILYHTLLTSLAGRTLGKAVMGLRVALKDGSTKIGLGRAFVRSALYLLTLYVAPLGVILLFIFEPPGRRQKIFEADALFHNQITDTAVIKT